MTSAVRLGAKVRDLRRRKGLTQAQLAEQLQISASYLNLIEHDRRPFPAQLLIRLASLFELDLKTFAAEEQGKLASELMEAFLDPLFEGHALTNADVSELVSHAPAAARAVLTLYEAYRSVHEAQQNLASRLSDGGTSLDSSRLPTEEVTDFIQHHGNFFPDLEEAADELRVDAHLERDDLYRRLIEYLDGKLGVRVEMRNVSEMKGAVKRYDAGEQSLYLSEILAPRSLHFQLAQTIGLLTLGETMRRLISHTSLASDESRALGRIALANYFAGAVLMPYERFLDAAKAERYDIELLGHRFRTSFEQVCHRLTTLRRPGMEGVPMHLLRVDIAGNISKRFSSSGIRFARFSGVCPKWNVHSAFITPGVIRAQLSRMPDGATYFCIASTVPKGKGGFHAPHTVQAIGMGCDVKHARELVYSDGMSLDPSTAVPVGVTCRLCERMDCELRAVPPLQQPFRVDENVRGLSFYAPPGE